MRGQENRYAVAGKGGFKNPWRKAGPLNSSRNIPSCVQKYTHLSLDFMPKIAFSPLSSALEAPESETDSVL
jgi:hypothetical protein